MEIFIGWIIFSVVVGAIGSGRKIGFFPAFFLSLILSPLVGLIVTLVSKSDEREAFEKKTIELQKKQVEAAQAASQTSVADEMRKLKGLLDEGIISTGEYTVLRDKLLK